MKTQWTWIFRLTFCLLLAGLFGASGSTGWAQGNAQTGPARPDANISDVDANAAGTDANGAATLPPGAVVTYPQPSAGGFGLFGAEKAPVTPGRVLVDKLVPGWSTAFGDATLQATQSARHPVAEALADGPEVSLTGWWSSETLQNDIKGITAIEHAPDGRVFVGVTNDGLRIYAPGAGGVYAWTAVHPPLRGLGLASNKVSSLAIYNGALWVGTADAGISMMDLDDGKWTLYNTSNSSLPSNVINNLTTFALGNNAGLIWVSTNGGAARFAAPSSWNVYTTGNGLPSNNVRDIAVQVVGLGAVNWISTDSGLITLAGATVTPVYGTGACQFDRATRLAVDNNSDVWIGAEDNVPALAAQAQKSNASDTINDPTGTDVWQPLGVCQYKRLSATWANYTMGLPGLPSNYVNDLDVDDAGRVWMGFAGGAAVYDQGSWGIFKQPASPLANPNVSAVHVVDEAVWLGHTNLTAVTRYSPNWLRYSAADLNGGGASPVALAIGSDMLWAAVGTGFSTRKTGDANWTFKNLAGNASNTKVIARDGTGHLWIGTAGNGVFEWNNNAILSHATVAEGLPSNQVKSIAIDHTDRLWVGTDAGLALRAEGYWVVFTTATSGIVSNDIQALGVDGLDRLWIGTPAGISILDADADNGPAWITQTTVEGLPSNNVTGLATEPLGAVWASTALGLARWDPATTTWTKHTQSSGALPDDVAKAVTSDAVGRARAGTEGGLAWQTASGWKAFHATGSAMAADQVGAVAADADRGWAVAGGGLALRGEIKGPIGNFAPVVSSFQPAQGPPGMTVTVTGSHFDPRGPEFNSVYFAYLGQAGFQAKVLTASATSLVVQVPVLVKPGKIYVRASSLTGQSSTDFKVAPVITSVEGGCLAPGELMKINGYGLNIGPYTTFVKVGGGAWRLADVADPTLVQTRILPGDTSGPVSVKLESNGPAVNSPSSIDIANFVVSGSKVQQGIDGQPMIWGKRTLVQVFAKHSKSGASCTAHITGGLLYWKKKTGSPVLGGTGVLASADGLTLGDTAPPVSMSGGVNFVAEFFSGRSGWTNQFPLYEFNGVQIKLKNGPLEVATLDLPASAFNYVDTQDRWYWTSMQVIPSNWSPAKEQSFWQVASENFAAAARIFPQQDSWATGGEHAWLGSTPIYYVRDGIGLYLNSDDRSDEDDGDDIIDLVDDFLDPSGDNYGAALVAPEAGNSDNTAAGLSTGGHTAFVFNDQDTGGKTFMHEATHNFGAVDSGQMNYSGGPNGAHSKYDEGQWDDIADCDNDLTFRQALIDETGKVQRVVSLTAGDPTQVPTNMCGPAAQAKSILSYAPNRDNNNVYLEPLEMQFVLAQTCVPISRCPGYSPSVAMQAMLANQNAVAQATARIHAQGAGQRHDAMRDVDRDGYQHDHAAAPGAASADNRLLTGLGLTPDALAHVDAAQSLRISGVISQTGAVEARISFVEDTNLGLTPLRQLGEYRLRLRGIGGQLLLDFPFEVSFRRSHGHGEDDHVHGRGEDGTTDHGSFNLRVPFPAGSTKAEITHDDDVLWSRTVSPHAPTASFVTPAGGNYSAGSIVPIQWTAADVDGDTLQFGLDYSADNGQTWLLIAPYVTANFLNWQPGYLPPSPTALLRLRASDGFNTATVVSAPFALSPKPPLAIISSPKAATQLTEDQTIDLVGDSKTAEGFGAGSFAWMLDNKAVGSGKHISLTLTAVGIHTIKLTVQANNLSATSSVTVSVIADYDHDGMPNDWELKYKLNPLSRSDAAGDADHDGVSNREEYRLGTNPRVVDTDGDGASDGLEVAADTDPLNPNSKPAAVPVLNVGASTLKMTVVQGGPSAVWPTWVTNVGAGAMNWNAVTDVFWLSSTPNIGQAPTAITIAAAPGNLQAGLHTGHLTFNGAGALKSPKVVTVTLEVIAMPQIPPPATFTPVTPMPGPTASSTPTPSPTATDLPRETDTPRPTEEPRSTATPTPTDEPRRETATPTDEPRPTATEFLRPSQTPTPTEEPTRPPRPTDEPTQPAGPTNTAEATRTPSPTSTQGPRPTATATRASLRWTIYAPYTVKNQRLGMRGLR